MDNLVSSFSSTATKKSICSFCHGQVYWFPLVWQNDAIIFLMFWKLTNTSRSFSDLSIHGSFCTSWDVIWVTFDPLKWLFKFGWKWSQKSTSWFTDFSPHLDCYQITQVTAHDSHHEHATTPGYIDCNSSGTTWFPLHSGTKMDSLFAGASCESLLS